MKQRMRKAMVLLVGILITIAAQMTFQYGTAKAETKVGANANTTLKKKVGLAKAENFVLSDVDGNKISLESLKGKVVLLNFWATWCSYCVREMPSLQSLHRKYGKNGLVILTVNLEDAQTAKDFMRAKGFTFKAVVDEESRVSDLYGVEVLPTTIIINRDGNIANRLEGARSELELLTFLKAAGLK